MHNNFVIVISHFDLFVFNTNGLQPTAVFIRCTCMDFYRYCETCAIHPRVGTYLEFFQTMA